MITHRPALLAGFLLALLSACSPPPKPYAPAAKAQQEDLTPSGSGTSAEAKGGKFALVPGPAVITVQTKADDTVTVQPCAEEVFTAVLNKLYPVIGRVPETIPALNQYDLKVKCLREWASTLKDACIQGNYVRWLDHYARESKENRDQLESGRAQIEDAYEAERKKEEKRVAAYERTDVIPTPNPSCERSLIDQVKP